MALVFGFCFSGFDIRGIEFAAGVLETSVASWVLVAHEDKVIEPIAMIVLKAKRYNGFFITSPKTI
jgi:hypothetical protein